MDRDPTQAELVAAGYANIADFRYAMRIRAAQAAAAEKRRRLTIINRQKAQTAEPRSGCFPLNLVRGRDDHDGKQHQ
jgi:hypothetical protein